MPKPMYVWSGSAWVSVAAEVESLATYATQSYAAAQPAMKMIVPTSVAVGSGTGAVDTNGAVTFSGASTVSLNDVFSASYDNYKVFLYAQGTAGAECKLRWRVSGADNTTSNYFNQFVDAGAGIVSGARNSTQTDTSIGAVRNGEKSAFEIAIFSPFATEKTVYISQQFDPDSNAIWRNYVGRFNASTSFTGFTLTPASGTFTGTIRVYGLKN